MTRHRVIDDFSRELNRVGTRLNRNGATCHMLVPCAPHFYLTSCTRAVAISRRANTAGLASSMSKCKKAHPK